MLLVYRQTRQNTDAKCPHIWYKELSQAKKK